MKTPDFQATTASTASTASAVNGRAHWKELDVLRGIAAVMMIVNHVGVKLLSPQEIEGGFTAALLFMASFAPVIFFFVTGVGTGIQSNQRKRVSRWTATLNKAGILLLADLLLAWSSGEWWRLDFLGFIGLSIVVLELIRVSKAPIALSVVGVVFITLLRYLIGPGVAQLGFDEQIWGISFILGTKLIPGVSYPLAPWLAYPLLGFIAGNAIARLQKQIEQQRFKVVARILGAAILPAIASLYLAFKGATFFRWGSMSLAFYILSFVSILICLATALVFCSDRFPSFVSKRLSLRGISSLAVVPIHYCLIDLLVWSGIGAVEPIVFMLWAVAVTAFSFFLAVLVEQEGKVLYKSSYQNLLKSSLIGIFVATACIVLTASQSQPVTTIIARTIGELVLCLLFVLPLPQPLQAPISGDNR